MTRADLGVPPGRRTAWASLACTLVAGLVVLMEVTLSDLPGPRWPIAWWISLTVLLGVQLVATGLLPRPRHSSQRGWLIGLVVLALGTFLLYPEHGLTAALLVVSAAAVAGTASRRALALVIVFQTVLGVATLAWIGWPAVDLVAGVLAFGGFQAFGALVVLAARGETEAKHELAAAHADLRATAALLEEATRDAERLRIARDLHDVIGHQLTGLSLELEVASRLLTDSARRDHHDAAQHVVRSRSIAKSLLSDVRTAIGEMREARAGLEPTLRSLAANAPGLAVSVQMSNTQDLRVGESRVVLRWAQEAITNTLRHAAAENLDLLVEADPREIRMRATDDGRGVDRVRPGHGLTGMQERLEALGGQLAIESAPGEGFSLSGRLPRSADGAVP